MMKNYVIGFLIVAFLSCSPKTVAVYHYDNSKVDDGDITSANLNGFFSGDKSVHAYRLRSRVLNEQLQAIKDSIVRAKAVEDLDDGYYGYAFITAAHDTLFADYDLAYWRYESKSVAYKTLHLKVVKPRAGTR